MGRSEKNGTETVDRGKKGKKERGKCAVRIPANCK